MKDMAEDFWLSVRHISSFRNKAEYEQYIEKEIEKYNLNKDKYGNKCKG